MTINKSCLFLALSALCVAGAPSAQAQAPKLWGEVSPGGKRVGFKTFEVSNGGRQVQVAEWYPAKKDNATRMTFGEYVRLTGPGGPDAAVAAFKKDLTAQGNSDATIDLLMNSPVYAVHDATPDQRKSNVIFVALGRNESPYNQAMLAEFYTSQGFVVVSAAAPTDVAPGDSLLLGLAQAQASDMKAIIDALQSDKNTAGSHVGIIGHTFGARAGMLMLNDARVTALLSLNGDIGNAKAGDWLPITELKFNAVKTPVMHLYETGDKEVQPEFRLIQKLAQSDRVFVHMGDGFTSNDFSSMGNAKGAIPGFQYGPPTNDVLGKIDFMNRLMYGWLLTYISGDASRFPSGLPKYIRIQRMTAGNAGSPS